MNQLSQPKMVVYINLHIPKNAGQTFSQILERLFGEQFVHVAEAWPGYILPVDEKAQIFQEHPEARCISGHAFRYPAPDRPGVEFRYLTFFRHPVERLISLYAYEQQVTASDPSHSSHGPIEEWIEARLAEDNALTNFQTFHPLGVRSPAELDFERACQMVDELFFVGIVERFDQALNVLARRMRRPIYDFSYRTANVTRSRERFPISVRVRQRLLELNQLDLQLYDYARQRLDRDLTEIPPRRLAAQMRQFHAVNAFGPAALPWRLRIARRLRSML